MALLRDSSDRDSTNSASNETAIDVLKAQPLQDSMINDISETVDIFPKMNDAAKHKKSLIEALENDIALMESEERSLEQNLKALSIEAQSLEQHLKYLTSEAQPSEQQLEAVRSIQTKKQEQLRQVEVRYAEHSRLLKPLLHLLNGFFFEDAAATSDIPSLTSGPVEQTEDKRPTSNPSK